METQWYLPSQIRILTHLGRAFAIGGENTVLICEVEKGEVIGRYLSEGVDYLSWMQGMLDVGAVMVWWVWCCVVIF